MARRRSVLALSLPLLALVCLFAASCADDDTPTVDPEARVAIDVAASVARGDGFLIGEPVLAEGWSMTFGEAKAEATEFGAGQAEIVGTPPPSHPVWLVRLTGIGVPPGPPTGGDRAETCLEILVIMNTQPLEDIMLAGKPSDAC